MIFETIDLTIYSDLEILEEELEDIEENLNSPVLLYGDVYNATIIDLDEL